MWHRVKTFKDFITIKIIECTFDISFVSLELRVAIKNSIALIALFSISVLIVIASRNSQMGFDR
jgi:hypothetical protein